MMRDFATEKEIIDFIQPYPIVSFDIFDTLIKRDVPKPSDLFDLIYSDQHFKKKRINAELICRKESKYEEITLEEIYNGLNGYSMEKELDFEYSICCVNKKIKKIYDYCIKSNKTIYIISDTYFSEGFVCELLKKNGIEQYDGLYVSSRYRLTKESGNLFRKVITENEISPELIVHIGDNSISDYESPHKIGIHSILIQRDVNNLVYNQLRKSCKNDLLYSFINNRVNEGEHFWSLGFECFGPLLYGFTKWLDNATDELNVDKILFLSRDGQIIQKAFDKINSANKSNIYFYASRRALLIPCLKYIDSVTDFEKHYSLPDYFTAEEFLRILDIRSNEDISYILVKADCNDLKFKKSEVEKDNKLKDLFLVAKDYLKYHIERELLAFKSYVESIKLTGNIAIVDIGWNGNMQINLEMLLKKINIDCNITGFYVGMNPSNKNQKYHQMQGYLCDATHHQKAFDEIMLFTSLFEDLFFANHGSVKRYSMNNSSNVEFYEMEDIGTEALNMIRQYQKGALDFIEEISVHKYKNIVDRNLSEKFLFNEFLMPNYKDACSWSKIIFEDVNKKRVVVTHSKQMYKHHPKQFLRDYKDSLWKPGFLKLTLGTDLKLYKMILLRNRLLGKK